MNKELENRIAALEKEIQALKVYGAIPYENIKALEGYLPKMLFGSATLDFPATSAGASSNKTITVYGAKPGDPVAIGIYANADGANSFFSAYVSAQDTVSVVFQNQSSISQNPDGALVFNVVVFQKP